MRMGLAHDQFLLVKQGSKTIEIRLNDEKRQQLKVGDTIVFEDTTTAQTQRRTVSALEKFTSFAELYHKYRGPQVGSAPTDSETKLVADTYQLYTVWQEASFGVLAIHLQPAF